MRITPLFLLLVTVVLPGCQHTRVTDPLAVDGEAAGPDAASTDFWHGLAERPLVSNNEAMHGLILLANQTDSSESYEQRLEWLKEQGLLSGGFNQPADAAVQRGTVAQVVANIVDIKGGLTMRLIGAHPRYATRELVAMEILPASTPQQGLPGVEFVGIISRAETYLKENGS